jgi:hypothetical protein
MGHLQAASSWLGEFVPFTGWSEPAEIEEAAAVQGRVGNPHDSSQAEQSLFIDFVSAYQIGVVTEIPQEPAEFPKRFGGAVETSSERTILMFTWFKDYEPQNVKRSLRMPAVEGPIDTNQENALQGVISCVMFAVQTGEMAFHGATSCDLA